MPVRHPLSSQFCIPDTLRNWPWPRKINPHYAQCKEESSAWCESFQAFSPKAQEVFNRCDFSLLACLAYPYLDKDGCRIGCDLMNLFFIIDEYSDIENANGARLQADIIMDALRNPDVPRPVGEWIGGEVARQFLSNARLTASESSQHRFIATFQLYMDSVVQQAQDRTESHIRGISDYFDVRRDTIGAKSAFVILEVAMNLADHVLEDWRIKNLTAASIDMIIIGNDLCSYNVEQARGDDGHNLVTIVMHELGESLKWISSLHDDLVATFISTMKLVPKYKDPWLNSDVAQYVDGLGQWVRSNDSWSFESERYFGKQGHDIQISRIVELLPKVKGVKDD